VASMPPLDRKQKPTANTAICGKRQVRMGVPSRRQLSPPGETTQQRPSR
jgi:hypothetical protein